MLKKFSLNLVVKFFKQSEHIYKNTGVCKYFCYSSCIVQSKKVLEEIMTRTCDIFATKIMNIITMKRTRSRSCLDISNTIIIARLSLESRI